MQATEVDFTLNDCPTQETGSRVVPCFPLGLTRLLMNLTLGSGLNGTKSVHKLW
ncbi:hypothetical protein ISCGN_022608 [Ixodes scapularis]